MPFFDIFASRRWSPLRMRLKVVSFFIFSRAFKKKLRLYDQRWLKYPQGGSALIYKKNLTIFRAPLQYSIPKRNTKN